MRTNNSHEFHGITLRNDGLGWTIQIKLLGRYRQIRTYAPNADEAARRHDVALSKLEGFAEESASPNFPDTYEGIDLCQTAFKADDGGLAFFKELHGIHLALCKEAEAVGLDPVEMAGHRKEAAKKKREVQAQRLIMVRLKFTERLFKIRGTVASLRFSAEKTQRLSDLMQKTQEAFDQP